MKKFYIWLVLMCFVTFMNPTGAFSNGLYTVDSNGNWIPTQQTATNYSQSSPSYGAGGYNVSNTNRTNTYNTTSPINNTANYGNNTYSNYSYGNQNTYGQANTSSYKVSTYNTINTSGTYNRQNIPGADDVPYSIQVQKVQKRPVNPNMSTVDLNTLVNQIGDNIVNKNRIGKKVTFIVNSDKVVNATTGIVNNITVYKGLIEYCEDEDELAFVIGHELGHAASSHVLKSYGVNLATGMAGQYAKMKLAEKINSKIGRWATNIAIDQTTDAVQNKISRGQEKDADMLSIDYVVAAGYNPLAGISIMNKIGNNYADFWSDHPSTDKRVISMYNYIKQKYPQYLEQGYDTYSYKQALANYIK